MDGFYLGKLVKLSNEKKLQAKGDENEEDSIE
jgi:hypothetical protein